MAETNTLRDSLVDESKDLFNAGKQLTSNDMLEHEKRSAASTTSRVRAARSSRRREN